MQGRFNETMYKEINEFDRMIVGVREWAVETIFRLGLEVDRWLTEPGEMPDTKIVLEEATKLEKYVLKDIPEKDTKN